MNKTSQITTINLPTEVRSVNKHSMARSAVLVSCKHLKNEAYLSVSTWEENRIHSFERKLCWFFSAILISKSVTSSKLPKRERLERFDVILTRLSRLLDLFLMTWMSPVEGSINTYFPKSNILWSSSSTTSCVTGLFTVALFVWGKPDGGKINFGLSLSGRFAFGGDFGNSSGMFSII